VQFTATYALAGDNADASGWAIYSYNYNGYAASIGCNPGAHPAPAGEYWSSCTATCNYLVTYDCTGKIVSMDQDNGTINCPFAALTGAQSSAGVAIPSCHWGVQPYIGMVCQ